MYPLKNLEIVTPLSHDLSIPMMMDDLFDGWLEMPSVANFLAEERHTGSVKQLKEPTGSDHREPSAPEPARLVLDNADADQSYEISTRSCLRRCSLN